MCIKWLSDSPKRSFGSYIGFEENITLIAFILFMIINIVLFFISGRRMAKLKKIKRNNGYCDEFFKTIIKYSGGDITKMKTGKLLKLAGLCAEGKRCKECIEIIKFIDFSDLNSKQQDEYFNIIVYNYIQSGEIDKANEIYSRCIKYFQREYISGNSCVIHTIAMLEFYNNNFERAEKLFNIAFNETKDPNLKFGCLVFEGFCQIKTGRKKHAKQSAVAASQYLKYDIEITQKKQLRELMIYVEEAYGRLNLKEKKGDSL